VGARQMDRKQRSSGHSPVPLCLMAFPKCWFWVGAAVCCLEKEDGSVAGDLLEEIMVVALELGVQ
jgi:hypothetical protein